jgi:hypothetical protein
MGEEARKRARERAAVIVASHLAGKPLPIEPAVPYRCGCSSRDHVDRETIEKLLLSLAIEVDLLSLDLAEACEIYDDPHGFGGGAENELSPHRRIAELRKNAAVLKEEAGA